MHQAYPLIARIQAETRIEHAILTGLDEYVSTVRRATLRAENRIPKTPLFDNTPPAGVHLFQSVLDKSSKEMPLVAATPDDIALIQYSTGTTDLPKGVMLTHANLIANTMQLPSLAPRCRRGTRAHPWRSAARAFVRHDDMHEFFHCDCRNADIAAKHANGSYARNDSTQSPHDFSRRAESVSRHQSIPHARKFGVRSIRACLSGAAPLPLEVQEAFEKITRGSLGRGLWADRSQPCHPRQSYFRRSRSGHHWGTLPDTDAKIVDLQTGWDLGVGDIGELVVAVRRS